MYDARMDEYSGPEIIDFRGKYFFLSNFYPYPIRYANEDWKTSEHAYQAAKTFSRDERQAIKDSETPGIAKRLGGTITKRPDWLEVRVAIMYDILEAKFSIPELEAKLLATGDKKLVEGNNWNDTFWGVDTRTRIGQNRLGKLLMQIRDHKRFFG